ncbi:MAG: DUF998 domain-containing protein [Brevundimonas sp.]|nr:MAG: DUF998 domain-containing protein [Brevundimonas sp.]
MSASLRLPFAGATNGPFADVDSSRPAAHRRPVNPAPSSRRYDLDWIRVGAFGLLILYHVGLAYAPYDWHLHSAHTFEWMREAVLITNPWRLTLLFFVSGAALRFMSARRTPREVLVSRLERLGPPLLFGIVVLVTIQSWIEAVEKSGWSEGYWRWLWHEFSPGGLINGVPVNHLWFVLYIAVYSLVAVALMRRPDWIEKVEGFIDRRLTGPWVLILPMAYLAVIRILLFPAFGVTNFLAWDWYNHALSLGAFLFGYLAARRSLLWSDLERYRWHALAVAAACLPVMMLQVAHPGGGAFLGVPRNLVFAIDQWAVIAAILGFANRHLRDKGGAVITYLTGAVFTCYLAHQTILVVALWFVRPWALPAGVEALTLVIVTLGGSLAIYEVVRRLPLVGPIWGLKARAPSQPVAVQLKQWLGQPGQPFRRRRLLLAVGVAAPLLALASVCAAILTYPDFDNARQYLSELGGASASAPLIFNGGVFVCGVLAAVAGVGIGLAMMGLCGARIAGALTAVVFVLAGFGLAASTLFPWPDPRHMVINLALGIQLAPLLLLWGLHGRKDLRRLKIFLVAVIVLMAILTVITKHLVFPGTVNDANVGWWERAYAIVLVGWVGVASLLLERRLRHHARGLDSPAM